MAVNGHFAAVLAKHSGHFSLVGAISWFEVATYAVHALARQIGEWHQISDEIVKLHLRQPA